MPEIVLVESSAALPGLFPLQCWEALSDAGRIWTRDPEGHPSAPYLALGGFELERLLPGTLDLTGVDLTSVGDPDDLRLVRSLLEHARTDGRAVYLLGPSDSDSFTRTLGHEAMEAGHHVEFVFHLEPQGVEMIRLAEVERSLRDPESGCPWDLEQDHGSLARHLIEESYELLEAIDAGDDEHIAEELGDVLLQVVFHAQIGADRGAFTIDDVARGIADKLVHRHPHVFADTEVADSAEVKENWEVLKQREKGREGPFEGVPAALPALQLAYKLHGRAMRLGFAWPDVEGAWEKVAEELAELRDATTPDERELEVGDLLSAVTHLSRLLGVDAEQALRRSAARFRTRFETVLEIARERDLTPEEIETSTWLALWEEAKQRLE
jgi:XTP/dITP diphosphohydrolase